MPPYDGRGQGGGGVGLKHHGGPNPANQDGDGKGGDSLIYSDFLDGMEADTWTLVTKTWYVQHVSRTVATRPLVPAAYRIVEAVLL